MAIFNMRRVFEDDTSTVSIICDPQGNHLCCALERGPAERIAIGKYPVSVLGFGSAVSDAAVKVAWHVVKASGDTAYRIPEPEEVKDAQRPHSEALDMLTAMLKPDDEIRIV